MLKQLATRLRVKGFSMFPLRPKICASGVPTVMWSSPNLSFHIVCLWPIWSLWYVSRDKVPGPSKNKVSILDIYLVQFLTVGMINKEPTNPATDCIK